MEFVELIKTAWPILAVGGGWIVSVERRLSSLGSLDRKVDKMDAKIDMIVNHLIDDK